MQIFVSVASSARRGSKRNTGNGNAVNYNFVFCLILQYDCLQLRICCIVPSTTHSEEKLFA